MSNEFSHIPDMTPSGTIERTLPHAFVGSEKPLVLIMKHASATWNPDFGNAHKRRAAELAATDDPDDEATRLSILAEIWAATVIVGWKNCNSATGEPLAYTPSRAVALLNMLMERNLKDQVYAAIAEAGRTQNFRTSPAAAVAALGK